MENSKFSSTSNENISYSGNQAIAYLSKDQSYSSFTINPLSFYARPSLQPSDAIKFIRSSVEASVLERKVISVDGRPGVGKTFFSDQLACELNARIVHFDDVYEKDGHPMEEIDKVKSGILVVEGIYSVDFQLDQICRVCVEVNSDSIRRDSIIKRKRSNDGFFLDESFNIELFGAFMSARDKFDIVVDNSFLLGKYVSN